MSCVTIAGRLISMEREALAPDFEGVSAEDWQRTPASIKRLLMALTSELAQLKQRVAGLEEENRHLRERLANNSSNSSTPPSSDLLTKRPAQQKAPSGKKRGAQPGHEGHKRKLYPVERCRRVVDHYPERCGRCGGLLSGSDPAPYRHQVVEIPPVEPVVEEHRLHQLKCWACGCDSRAKLTAEALVSGYGLRLTATVALLAGVYRTSERLTQAAMRDLYGVELSVGTVNKLRREVSEAVAGTVAEAHSYLKEQAVVNADETGFAQGDADGGNPAGRKAWLWVAATALVTVFQVNLGRGQEAPRALPLVAARRLLGPAFVGVVISDRWSGYNWLPLSQRQLCWAHLKREFQKIAEREGESEVLGAGLLEQQRKLFELWYRVRDGTLSRPCFQDQVATIRQHVKVLLEQGASYRAKRGEKTLRAKTARTCQGLLKFEPALWLFVYQAGVEPTNNAAERAIRPAVLWRKTSFGTQSAAGSVFVARMLTVVTTLRQQDRNVLAYLTQACQASRQDEAAPSLLPQGTEFEIKPPVAA